MKNPTIPQSLIDFIASHSKESVLKLLPNFFSNNEASGESKNIVQSEAFNEPIKGIDYSKQGRLHCVTKFSRLCQK